MNSQLSGLESAIYQHKQTLHETSKLIGNSSSSSGKEKERPYSV